MAGIGFRLQKLLNSRSYCSLAAAYGYSAVISSGPWMLSILSLVVIGIFISGDAAIGAAGVPVAAVFRIVVTYVYAGSLLLGGLIHLGVARYVSDRLYATEMEEVLPTFMRSAAALLLAGLLCSSLWFAFSGLSASQAVAAVLMFQSLSLTWLCMVFLSAAKGYEQIVWGFFFANAIGAALAVGGHGALGLDGTLWGYAVGQFLLAYWLSRRIFLEFPSYSQETNGVLAFLWEKRNLAFVGFAFNLGVWTDKFMVWHSSLGTGIVGWFRCAESYDASLFFAYLTIIPAMALFLIRIETAFYRSYSMYFTAVTCGGDLTAIEEGKEKIKASLWLSAARLSKFQGGITLCLILAAPMIAPRLGLSVLDIPLLRFSLAAAFLQALLLFMLIFFLYFDWHRRSLVLSLLFLGMNAAFTWATIAAGRQYLGLGYLFANFCAILVGVFLLNAGMERLEFETFAKQIEKT